MFKHYLILDVWGHSLSIQIIFFFLKKKRSLCVLVLVLSMSSPPTFFLFLFLIVSLSLLFYVFLSPLPCLHCIPEIPKQLSSQGRRRTTTHFKRRERERALRKKSVVWCPRFSNLVGKEGGRGGREKLD